MERTPLQSSNLTSIGYDAKSNTLEVEFLNGSLYQYFDVPENVYEGLINAVSHGQFLNQVVKGNFRYARL
jgi:hypothetical protein